MTLILQLLVSNNDVSNSNNDDSENAFLSSSSCLRPLAGIGVSALAAFLFSISNVFIKEAEDLSTFVIATYRNAMMLMFSTPILIDKSLHPFPKGGGMFPRYFFLYSLL